MLQCPLSAAVGRSVSGRCRCSRLNARGRTRSRLRINDFWVGTGEAPSKGFRVGGRTVQEAQAAARNCYVRFDSNTRPFDQASS